MIRTYEITHPNVAKETTIFLISDLHYESPKDLKKYHFITKELEKKKPSLLLIAGDLLDSAVVKEEHLLIELIKKWARVPVLIVMGNHDMSIIENKKHVYCQNEAFWEKLKKIENVFILENTSYEIKDIKIFGVTVPYSYYCGEETPLLIEKTSDYKMNIILAHAASSLFQSDLKKVDLVLAGHNHNGLVPYLLEPIMKKRGVISPTKKLFPNFSRGCFFHQNTKYIISGGVTKLSKRSHLDFLDPFWKHELTKIIIKPKL